MDALSSIWPIFRLVIQTPNLVLRLPVDSDLTSLARQARLLEDSSAQSYYLPWIYEPSPGMERQLVQRHWRALAHWRPESWNLQFAIYINDRPVGCQSIWANDFATIRSVGTGSWIAPPYQGKGYGTEARAAVLNLAFTYLGAEEAHSEYIEGNAASVGVSRKLGYVSNGRRRSYRDDKGVIIQNDMLLDRSAWLANHEHWPDSTVHGLAICREMFGE
ncbi:GNAT family N-acetyltransferase [Parafrankia discariae]|uniref:GNAT family N-acetyltransferase n=1 Tax=Parafrankia discariae TaxID=365528 RepID=UPI0009785398|nr:GNAT family N-acetyltransferase [Parafrankia discariae]